MLKTLWRNYEPKKNYYKSKGDENTSIEQCLEKIRPYLGNMIDDLRASGEWKIHITKKIIWQWQLASSHQKTEARVSLCILRAITQTLWYNNTIVIIRTNF